MADPTPTRRPPAGGLEAADGAGRVLTIDGITYLVNDAGELVKLSESRGVLTAAQRAEIADLIGSPEANPAGNPYRTGAA